MLLRKFSGMFVANVLEPHFLRPSRTDVTGDDRPDSALRTITAGAQARIQPRDDVLFVPGVRAGRMLCKTHLQSMLLGAVAFHRLLSSMIFPNRCHR
jgi:hypothetical protein